MKKTIIIIGTILLSSKAAKAFDYGQVINNNKVDIGYNAVYSEAEKRHMIKLNRAKKEYEQTIEAYRQAHLNAMRSDARLRELENQLPQHRTYVSDWADGQVQGKIR